MNILFVITRADAIGGAQVHVKDLAISLQQDGHKVLVLTGEKGIYNEDLRQSGIESVACESLSNDLNPIADGKTLRYILHIINLFKPELIATHSSKAGILGRLASKIAKIPCTFTAHGWAFTPGIPQPKRTAYKWIETVAAPLADKIICVSEHDRTIAAKAGINVEKLLTIHNGMKDITNELASNPGKSAPVKIAMIARFDRQKDHATLIEAFKDLDAELILVGDGINLPVIRQQVEALGIAHKVKFLGFRPDIPEILARVQIFALISHWEGLPCTIIEAMRAGLPVVASNVGGVKEIVIEAETGYTVSPQDSVTLNRKLSYLIENEQVRIDLGRQARQKYESQLTFQHMYEKTLAAYHETISEQSLSQTKT